MAKIGFSFQALVDRFLDTEKIFSNHIDDKNNPHNITGKQLDLGTSAKKDVGTNPDNVMEVGAFGLGGLAIVLTDLNISTDNDQTQFNSYSENTANAPTTEAGIVITIVRADGSGSDPGKVQMAITSSAKMCTRVFGSGSWRDWNLPPET